MARSRTRTFVLIGVSIFNIERYVVSAIMSAQTRSKQVDIPRRTIFYVLRAYASQRVGSRESIGLEVYFQGTLASGYVTLGQDLTSLARALFVNATKSSDVPEGFVHNEQAFIAFSHGPMNCVGKGLAMQEMRAVVVALMQRFHIRAAGGDMEGTLDLGKYERGYKDFFVSARPPLPVVLEQREGSV